MARGERDRARVRLEGLDDHTAGRVAPAAARELGDELEGALLRAEVGEPERGIGVDDGRERNPAEVMPLGDHLRPQQDPALGGGEAPEDLGEQPWLGGDVRVEPEPLQLRQSLGQLGLELLRAGTDARHLGRPAGRTELGRGLAAPAMVAVEATVGVERQRDVAVRAAEGEPAGPAVQRGCDSTTVEEEDGLAPAVGELAERGQERGRQRVARLAPEIDDLHGRQGPREPSAQLQALQPLPALRARRRAPVDGDGALERGALGGDGARVVARVGLLLVGGVVLLVHADEPERGNRCEHGGAGADDDRGVAGGDPLTLVAALGVRERGVQDGDALPEAGTEAAQRLRRQRDLGNEDDRAAAARERLLAGPQVDLGLAAAGGAVEQERPPARVQSRGDPGQRSDLRRAGLGGRLLGRQVFLTAAAPGSGAACAGRGRHQAERPRRRRAVVLGHPEREVDQGCGDRPEDALDRDRLDLRGRLVLEPDDDPAAAGTAEADGDDGALLQPVSEVREGVREGTRRHERHNGGKPGHGRIIADMAAGHTVEDYLETIYFLAFPIGEYKPETKGAPTLAVRVADMLGVSRASAGEMLKRLEAEGLVERGEHKEAILTAKGREVAERVVRKHRIIERLLTDFMGYTAAEAHVQADLLGNTFTDDMVERIEKQLGRPDRCPHGWPVDVNFEQAENRELKPLSDLAEGESAEIVRLAEHDGELLHWYYDEGLVPGTKIELLRAEPAAGQFALAVDGADRAIGEKAAAGLFVRPAA